MIIVLLIATVLALLALRWFLKADPAALAGALKSVLFVAAIILAVLLLFTGRINLLFPLAIACLPFLLPYIKRYFGQDDVKNLKKTMTKSEALEVLGLEKNATKAQIIAAHKRLIKKLHPDTGGSDYLAQKLNAAKDFLIKD